VRRAAPGALAVALLLAGCPLPQPLPDYPPGTITPPRIVVDDSVSRIANPEAVVWVPANCPTTAPPQYPLTAPLRDANTIERIEVRWFVNYDPTNSDRYRWDQQDDIEEVDPLDPTLRHIPPFVFLPYDYDSITGSGSGSEARRAPGAVRVVELVASNGFYARTPYVPGASTEPFPNRSPAPGFEVQVYRWVFLNVLNVDEGGSVECPDPPP
jgi:hypothetical protein